MNEAFQTLRDSITELVDSFYPEAAFGDLNGIGLTQYSFWMLLSAAVMLIVLFVFKKKQAASIVPRGMFVNGMEAIVEFIKNVVLKDTVGKTWRVHFPFIATIFLFVLFNNLIGMLPTLKPGTGCISTTLAVAICSFVYFIYIGMKRCGVVGYIKSLAPADLMSGPLVVVGLLVWFIEVFSTFLRLVTLAVRLFCNMFAGHVVMGVFAMTCSIFVQVGLKAGLVGIGIASTSFLWAVLLLVIYIIEIMIAAIQAYIFALLSAVYVQLAEQED